MLLNITQLNFNLQSIEDKRIIKLYVYVHRSIFITNFTFFLYLDLASCLSRYSILGQGLQEYLARLDLDGTNYIQFIMYIKI